MNNPVPIQSHSPVPYRFITVILLLVVSILLFGYIHFVNEKKTAIEKKSEELSAIADLKVSQIVNWRRERMVDALVIYDNPVIPRLVNEFALNPNSSAGNDLRLWISSIKRNREYKSVVIADPKFRILLTSGNDPEIIGAYARENIKRAISERKVSLSDLHRNKDIGEIHMDLYIPLFFKENKNYACVGAILIRLDPYNFIYPLIRTWPTPSKTAETLIVNRQGDDIVYLNELRHRQNTALKLRKTVAYTDLPAAMAVKGVEKVVEGVDYRGVKVIAALRKIPDSPWFMVSKIDREEVIGPVLYGERFALATLIILILLAAATIWVYWYRNDAEHFKKLYQAELDRRALEKLFVYLTKYANDIIILAKADNRIIEVNDKALEVYGYTREELLSMKFPELRVPSQRPASGSVAIEEIKKLKDQTFEAIHRRKDGTEFPVEVSARVMDVDGEEYFQGIIRDISERKILEKRMEAFFTESPAGLCMWDDEFRWVKINKKMADINGFKVAQHIGKSVTELLPELSPQLMPMFREIINNGRSYLNMEVSGQTARDPGFVHSWIASYFPLPGSGNRRNFIGSIVVEITDWKRVLEELREERDRAKMYFDIAGVLFVVLDKEGRILMLNKKGYDILGYGENELFGRNWFDVCVAEGERAGVKDIFRKIMQGDPVAGQEEYYENEILTRKGERRVIAFHNAVLRNEKNEIIGTLSSGEDVTEKRAAEAKVLKLNEELEERVKERTGQLEGANKELEAFAYSVSHDLRAPLRAIDGFSKIVLEDYSKALDSEAVRLLNVIRKNTTAMAKLIDDLLNFAKVGRLELSVSLLNIEEIVSSIVEEVKTANHGRNINFVLHGLNPAKGDANLVRQVFVNLLSNAAKFTRTRGSSVIEVGCNQGDKENIYYVKDNGVGFDMKFAGKLFGVFVRLHSEKDYEGNGIGLALVSRIIGRHGGKVWAESKPEEGAVFYFTLPV